MSLNTTSYRYEVMTESKSLRNALERQKEQICTDKMMASREQQDKIAGQLKLKSDWKESLAHVAGIQKAKSDAKVMKAELRMAHKVNLMVRKAALKQLFVEEYQQFEKEFHGQGRAFYIKRT